MKASAALSQSTKEELTIEKIYYKKRSKRFITIFFLCLGLIFTIICAVSIGPVKIPINEVAIILLSKFPFLNRFLKSSQSHTFELIVIYVRLPRILLGALVGSALAMAGVIMQGMFRNPLASPYVLGISSGAAFGVSLVVVSGLGLIFGRYSLPFMAFLFSILTIFLVYNIARIHGKVPVETLLLAGLAVGIFFSAMNSFMRLIAGEKLIVIISWIMGSLVDAGWDDVVLAAPPILVGATVLLLFARDLNAMLTGEEAALSLGTNVEMLKKILFLLSSLIVATAISVSGSIGFVGLIIPHIMRDLVGPDHRILLPSACLAGAIFLILTDTLARIILVGIIGELPVGIITALIGAPFFIYLLRKRKRTLGW